MSTSRPSFSLLRRHSAGRALAARVQGQVRAGRGLAEIMDDEIVREALARHPELLEDLETDQELREELAAARLAQPGAVVGYDGSPASRRALERAAAILPASRVLVVHVWEPADPALVVQGAGHLLALPELLRTASDLDRRAEAAARARAEEGAALARALGLDAEAVAARVRETVWNTLATQALGFDADVVVIGTRARSCSRALLGGSVAHAASGDGRVPVLVVPAPRRPRAAAAAEPDVGRIADLQPGPLPLPLAV